MNQIFLNFFQKGLRPRIFLIKTISKCVVTNTIDIFQLVHFKFKIFWEFRVKNVVFGNTFVYIMYDMFESFKRFDPKYQIFFPLFSRTKCVLLFSLMSSDLLCNKNMDFYQFIWAANALIFCLSIQIRINLFIFVLLSAPVNDVTWPRYEWLVMTIALMCWSEEYSLIYQKNNGSEVFDSFFLQN